MSRGLSATVIAQITGDFIPVIYFVKLEFDGGDLLLWTGEGTKDFQPDITIAADTYTGSGELLTISPINESARLESTGVTLVLNITNAGDVEALALAEYYQGRQATIYEAYHDGAQTLVQEGDGSHAHTIRFLGFMEVMVIDDAAQTITLRIESPLSKIKKMSLRRYVTADQRIEFPTDKGPSFVTSLNSGKKIDWED